MTSERDTRDLPQRRDGGLGLLVVVVTILVGTAWTVGSFLESDPAPIRAAGANAQPARFVQDPGIGCEVPGVGCDIQTLTPLPSWQTNAIAPEDLLRAANVDRPEGTLEARRSAGVATAPWECVSAPAVSDVNG